VRPVDQVTDAVGRPLEDGFDPAIGEVADPAGHAVLLGQAAAGVAEEDALDPAGNQYPVTHHKQTVRRGGGLTVARDAARPGACGGSLRNQPGVTLVFR